MWCYPFIYRITEIVNMKQIPLKVDEQEVITKITLSSAFPKR